MHRRILRTIDANLNRVSEGLRVLEDISRFIIEDASSSKKLKSIRHQLSKAASGFNQDLLNNRDVNGDVGASMDFTSAHENLAAVIRANSKRVQEGLRVLEELSKLPLSESTLCAARLKESRYLVYSIEKILMQKLLENNEADRESREKGDEQKDKKKKNK